MANNYVWDDASGDWLKTINPTQVSSSGLGSMYDDLINANPYRDLHYHQSDWQRFLSRFGFRTSYDDYVEEAERNAKEYDAGILSMKAQNEFNSPEQMASRMRSAGLNPDLQGLSDVAESAQPTEDPNGMSPLDSSSQFDDFFKVCSSIGSQVLGIIPQTMSFISNLSQLRGIRADNDRKELEFNSGAIDYATKFFTETLTEKDYKEAFDTGNYENLLDASRKDSRALAEMLFSNKNARKRFNLTYNQHARSLVAELSKYKTWDEFEKARKSLFVQRASPYFSDDNETMMSLVKSVVEPIEYFNKRISEIQNYIAQHRSSSAESALYNKQVSNQLAYENAIDTPLQAEAENTSNEYMKQMNEILKEADDMFAKAMKSLSAKDTWYNAVAKTLLGVLRSQVMGGLHLQYGRSSSYHIDVDSGAVTSESSSSRLGF